MVKNDKFIGDILAPFEKTLGLKFNKFDKPSDPKYEEPKKKVNLNLKLKKAERKQKKLKKMDPEEAKKVHWGNAMDKALGKKVKDDPKLIKKAIKRKTDEKKKHKKKWAERVERQEEAKRVNEKRKMQKRKAKSKKGKAK